MSAKQLELLLEGSDMVVQLSDYLVSPLKLKIEDIQQLCDVHKKGQICNPVLVRGHLDVVLLCGLKHPDFLTQLKEKSQNFPAAQPPHLPGGTIHPHTGHPSHQQQL